MRTTLLFLLSMTTLALAQQASNTTAPAGQKIFEEYCVRCHAADGSSNTFVGHKWKIPDLRSDTVQKLTIEQRIQIITEGKERMPAQKNKLTTEEIRQVESYVRELGKKSSTPAQ